MMMMMTMMVMSDDDDYMTMVILFFQVMLAEFTRLWTPIAGFESDQIKKMEEGGYYYIRIQERLYLLSINTLYMYVAVCT